MACRGRCEDKVKILNEIITRGETAYQKAGSAYMTTAIVYGLLGILITGLSLLSVVLTGNKGMLSY